MCLRGQEVHPAAVADAAQQRFSETHTNNHLLLTHRQSPNVHVM